MHFHVHHHVVPSPEVLDRLDVQDEKLDLIYTKLKHLENTLMLDFTKIVAATARQEGIANSTLQVLGDLNAQVKAISADLAAAIAAQDTAGMAAAQVQLDSLAAGIDANDDKLATAIAAPGVVGAVVEPTPVAVEVTPVAVEAVAVEPAAVAVDPTPAA